MRSVKVKCPASLSNLVCGYDIFGMAVEDPFDTIELSLSDKPGIEIVHLDDFGLSTDPEKNIAGVALQSLIKDQCDGQGFRMIITKKIKPGSGIGSSAASAAGIIYAADKLLNLQLSKKEMLSYAMNGEMIASGTRHADNLAPLIYGGFTLIRDAATFDIISVPAPQLFITILHPQIEVKTSYARKILPEQVPLSDAVKQWANTAAMVAGFSAGDYGLIGRSMKDHIVEPVRSKLIPGYEKVIQASMEAGAIGGGISGSGPSMFMFSADENPAQHIEKAITKVYQALNIDFKTYITTLNKEGIKETE